MTCGNRVHVTHVGVVWIHGACGWMSFLLRSFELLSSPWVLFTCEKWINIDGGQKCNLKNQIGTGPPPFLWTHLDSQGVFLTNDTSRHLGGAASLSQLRLRVEQGISSLSPAERWGTHHRRLEELLGWWLWFAADFMFFLVKWLESYKSYIAALPGTWNVHVASDACQKSRLRIWYFLDRLFEVLGLQLKNERHNLCLWATGSPHLVAMQMWCKCCAYCLVCWSQMMPWYAFTTEIFPCI